ncbi:hypothetical protein [Pseudonocardia spinosispora]|uniref:hypothetical protein n=1 Tax=Pseudonocardia spinosispora TaxID=103441 RepID=UPI0003FA9CD8|nr:hypothetical protein [Pseudonocardia spinosispora]
MDQQRWVRAVLVAFGAGEAGVGSWAQVAPSSFYTDFPGWPWHGWVTYDGPFNEHLIRDFGGLNLALAVTLVGAAIIGSVAAARVAGAASLVFSLPHTIFHWAHIEHYPPVDQVPAVATAAVGVLVAVIALLVPGRAPS